MAMTAGSPVFVDTNILVYARLATVPQHADAVNTLDRLTKSGAELWTSRQVLREYLAAMTRPGAVIPPHTPATLVADVRGFEARFRITEDGPAVTTELLRLLATITSQGKQIHDANIVATLLAHGIPNLFTHNVTDFARFAGMINVIPLVLSSAASPPSPSAPPSPPGAP